MQNTSPWLSSVGTPYRSIITGSGSSLTPVRRANASPSRKSRLPCRTYTATPLAVRRGEAGAGAGVVGIVIVVAHPDFEQVAEQVERFGGARGPVEEGEERIDGPGGLAVEVKVGSEQAVASERSLRRRRSAGGIRPEASPASRPAVASAGVGWRGAARRGRGRGGRGRGAPSVMSSIFWMTTGCMRRILLEGTLRCRWAKR